MATIYRVLAVFVAVHDVCMTDCTCAAKEKIPTKGSPEVVREGNAQVKIYASTNRGRPMFSLVFKGVDGHRKTRDFADYGEAKLEAENVAIAIYNGTLDSL